MAYVVTSVGISSTVTNRSASMVPADDRSAVQSERARGMLSESTKRVIEAAIEGDAAATAEERRRVRSTLEERVKRQLVTVRKAAELCQVHPRTIQRYAREGKLVAIRFSKRRMRFDQEQVLRLANEGIQL
jgi:excisionase family DNA binding protein